MTWRRFRVLLTGLSRDSVWRLVNAQDPLPIEDPEAIRALIATW